MRKTCFFQAANAARRRLWAGKWPWVGKGGLAVFVWVSGVSPALCARARGVVSRLFGRRGVLGSTPFLGSPPTEWRASVGGGGGA